MNARPCILLAAAALLCSQGAHAQPPSAPDMVEIPGGVFAMGATVDRGYGPIDGPTHDVRVRRFALAKREVTVGEFRAFVKATGYAPERKCNVYDAGTSWHIDPARSWSSPGFAQDEDHPVVCVSWADTQAYMAWLGAGTGERYRLPSEAEMEYVTQAGGVDVSHATANIGKVECCGGAAEGRDVWIETAPVASFPADRLGLHDIRGNVWEWQADCYHANYDGAPDDGTARTACPEPGYHSIRGGSYGDAGEFHDPRFRLRGPADQGFFTVGFRLTRDL
ncbi:formylglycine-generating enzyme family protein [Sphingosinicella microcystinivorans]|uniref:formylglycine-generating enzyme family protein n=1 Tax=Sphingosinicella microcystinivorans TaxID=335406 RepID=UPI0022F3EF7E|nr:SUMF1/EgtB/PvdO family nonheme iron enzyme [Sphingosinicella microcystinivorans]WBX86298.1 SUMF1/EgtB/PvdO family nonheme iron enzyme [Sphingosinicella microcystinivorans]